MTLGLYVNLLDTEYQTKIWDSVKEFCKDRKIRTALMISRTLLSSSEPEWGLKFWNAFLIAKKVIDGVIITAESIPEDILAHPDRAKVLFESVPIVTVSGRLDSLPNVLIDNASGITEAVNHLVEIHSLNKIAFIRGPENNNDANNRLKAYKKALKNLGLTVDESLITPPLAYSKKAGLQGVNILAKRNKLDYIEAIITADDEIAKGVFEGLAAKGYDIPRDIAVIGFDDSFFAASLNPSLTTIGNPFSEQGYAAARLLKTHIDAGNNKKVQTGAIPRFLQTRLTIRQSCGCAPNYLRNIHPLKREETTELSGEPLCEMKDLVCKNIITLGEKTIQLLDKNWIQKIGTIICNTLSRPFDSEQYTRDFKQFLKDVQIEEHQHEMLKHIFTLFKSEIMGIPALRPLEKKIEHIYYVSLEIIVQLQNEAQLYYIIRKHQMYKKFQDLGQSIISVLNHQELFELLETELPSIGVSTFFLNLFESSVIISREEVPPMPATSFIAAGLYRATPLSKDMKNRLFSNDNILPDFLLDEISLESYIIIPVIFQTVFYGYIIYEPLLDDNNLLEQVTQMVINAFKKISLMNEHVSLEQKLISVNKDLLIKQQEMDNKNKAIHVLNEQLKEKTLFKSKYLANMSHELRTPLNSIIGTNDYLIYSREILYNNLYDLNQELIDLFEPHKMDPECAALLEYCAATAETFLDESLPLEFAFPRELEEQIKNYKHNTDDLREIKKLIREIHEVTCNEFDSREKNLEEIKIHSKYLLDLINVLLRIAKIEAGKVELKRKEVNLRGFIDFISKEALKLKQNMPHRQSVTFRTEIASDVPVEIFIDQPKITEAILHLVSNAFQFTTEGEVFFKTEYINQYIYFSIHDTGIGIAEKDRDVLFTEFGKVRRNEQNEGMGFGLVLVKKMVQMHDGRVKVISTPGEGSQFMIRLPMPG